MQKLLTVDKTLNTEVKDGHNDKNFSNLTNENVHVITRMYAQKNHNHVW